MHSEKGQSLIEVLVAVTVGVLVVTALTFATIFSLRNAQFAKNSAQATKLAQEGIERVRIGRDRNQCITLTDVDSWNGNSSDPACSGSDSFWSYPINTNCGPNSCYFNVNSSGALNYLTSSATFPPVGTESIPPMFNRAIMILDDSATYTSQKTVTVIVRWSDFSGPHESRLTTILRKL